MYFMGWVTVGMGWLLASGVLGLACRIGKGLGLLNRNFELQVRSGDTSCLIRARGSVEVH